MATALAACGNKQATTDENGKPIVNILVRRNVTDNARFFAHFRIPGLT